MERRASTKFFSRSNVLKWSPLIAGIFIVNIIFGRSEGPTGIAWKVLPVVIGLLYSFGFLWFGIFLSIHFKWPLKLLILVVSSSVLITSSTVLLILTTSADPQKEFGYLLPGEMAFSLVWFFTAWFTVMGFLWRSYNQKDDA